MKYPVNRLRVGQTIRARSGERGGGVVMTIQRIRWNESTAVLYDAEGRTETMHPFDWVELLEEKNNGQRYAQAQSAPA